MNRESAETSRPVTADPFRFTDDLGPEKIVQICEVSTGLRAVVVIDNIAAGPSIGGVRMAPDVSIEECFRLARAMTMKNAAAGLRHGGGKSVLYGDPAGTQTGLRSYWSNQATMLVSDVPGEIMLFPNRWGDARFEGR